MAKLTEEQKAINKQAQSVRDAAYRQRLSERAAAATKAEAEVELLPERVETRNITCEMDVVLAERNSRESEIKAKIAEMEGALKSVREEYSLKLDEIKIRRDDVMKALDIKAKKIRGDATAGFADLNSCYGAGTWFPPQGYVEKYAEANADVLAAKAAKRAKNRQ